MGFISQLEYRRGRHRVRARRFHCRRPDMPTRSSRAAGQSVAEQDEALATPAEPDASEVNGMSVCINGQLFYLLYTILDPNEHGFVEIEEIAGIWTIIVNQQHERFLWAQHLGTLEAAVDEEIDRILKQTFGG